MYSLDELPAQLRTHFLSMPGMQSYTYVTEFPSVKIQNPLTKIMVSFGTGRVRITTPTDGNGDSIFDSWHNFETEIRVTIHLPRTMSGTDLLLAFSRITTEMLENCGLDIIEISTSGPRYNAKTGTAELVAYYKIFEKVL